MSAGAPISNAILPENPQVMGDLRVCFANYTVGSTYVAGGDTLTPSQFGLSQVAFVVGGSVQQATATGAVVSSWDATNQKLQFFVTSTGAEIATTAASGFVFSLAVYGY